MGVGVGGRGEGISWEVSQGRYACGNVEGNGNGG